MSELCVPKELLRESVHNDINECGEHYGYFLIYNIQREWFDKITKCIWEKREYKLVKKLPKFTYHRLESKTERSQLKVKEKYQKNKSVFSKNYKLLKENWRQIIQKK